MARSDSALTEEINRAIEKAAEGNQSFFSRAHSFGNEVTNDPSSPLESLFDSTSVLTMLQVLKDQLLDSENIDPDEVANIRAALGEIKRKFPSLFSTSS
jgi:hypothetical protein